MEGDSTNGFDMAQYELELDKGIAGVLPRTHEVHGTITIRESDLSGDALTTALKVFDNVRGQEKFATKPSEALAELVIERIEKKLNES